MADLRKIAAEIEIRGRAEGVDDVAAGLREIVEAGAPATATLERAGEAVTAADRAVEAGAQAFAKTAAGMKEVVAAGEPAVRVIERTKVETESAEDAASRLEKRYDRVTYLEGLRTKELDRLNRAVTVNNDLAARQSEYAQKINADFDRRIAKVKAAEDAQAGFNKEIENLQKRYDRVTALEKERAADIDRLNRLAGESNEIAAKQSEYLKRINTDYDQQIRKAREADRAQAGVNERFAQFKNIAGSLRGVLAGAFAGFSIGAISAGVKDAIADFDALAKSARSLENINVAGFLQESRFALGQLGFDEAGATKLLSDLQTRAGQFKLGTGELGQIALRVEGGDEFAAALKNARSLEETFDITLKKLGEVEDASKRAALAGAVFGEEAGKKIGALAEAGVDGFDELQKQAREAGLVVERDVLEKAERLNDRLSLAGQVIDTQLKRAFIELGPVIVGITELTANLIKATADGLRELRLEFGRPENIESTTELDAMRVRLEQEIARRETIVASRAGQPSEVADVLSADLPRLRARLDEVNAAFLKMDALSITSTEQLKEALYGSKDAAGATVDALTKGEASLKAIRDATASYAGGERGARIYAEALNLVAGNAALVTDDVRAMAAQIVAAQDAQSAAKATAGISAQIAQAKELTAAYEKGAEAGRLQEEAYRIFGDTAFATTEKARDAARGLLEANEALTSSKLGAEAGRQAETLAGLAGAYSESERAARVYTQALELAGQGTGVVTDRTLELADAIVKARDAQRTLEQTAAIDRQYENLASLQEALGKSSGAYEVAAKKAQLIAGGWDETVASSEEAAQKAVAYERQMERITAQAQRLKAFDIDPLADFTANIAQAGVDIFQRFREEGFSAFEDLGDRFTDIFKRALRDIFAKRVLEPLLAPLVNIGLGSTGLGSTGVFGGNGGGAFGAVNAAGQIAGTGLNIGAPSYSAGLIAGANFNTFGGPAVAGASALSQIAPLAFLRSGVTSFAQSGGQLLVGAGNLLGAGPTALSALNLAGGALGAGAFGYLGGQALSDLVGLSKGGVGRGALSGAATGAAIGSVIPGIGTVVGAIAGAIVGGLKNLFAGKPSNYVGQLVFDPETGAIKGAGQKDSSAASSANYKIAEGVQSGVSKYVTALVDATGGVIKNVASTAYRDDLIAVKAGDRTGIVIGNQGAAGEIANAQTFDKTEEGAAAAIEAGVRLSLKNLDTPFDAVDAYLKKNVDSLPIDDLANGLQSLSELFKGIEELDATARAAVGTFASKMVEAGRPVDDIVEKSGKLAAVYESTREPVDAFAQRARDVNEAIDPLIADFKALGESTQDLQKIQRDALAKVGQDRNDLSRQQLLGVTNPLLAQVEAQIKAFTAERKGAEEALAAGAPVDLALLKQAQTANALAPFNLDARLAGVQDPAAAQLRATAEAQTKELAAFTALIDAGLVNDPQGALFRLQTAQAGERATVLKALPVEDQLRLSGSPEFEAFTNISGRIGVVLAGVLAEFDRFEAGLDDFRAGLEEKVSAGEQLVDQYDRALISYAGSGAPGTQLNALRAEFQDVVERAVAGDSAARASVVDLGGRLREKTLDVNASSLAGQADLRLVEAGVARVRDVVAGEVSDAKKQIDLLDQSVDLQRQMRDLLAAQTFDAQAFAILAGKLPAGDPLRDLSLELANLKIEEAGVKDRAAALIAATPADEVYRNLSLLAPANDAAAASPLVAIAGTASTPQIQAGDYASLRDATANDAPTPFLSTSFLAAPASTNGQIAPPIAPPAAVASFDDDVLRELAKQTARLLDIYNALMAQTDKDQKHTDKLSSQLGTIINNQVRKAI